MKSEKKSKKKIIGIIVVIVIALGVTGSFLPKDEKDQKVSTSLKTTQTQKEPIKETSSETSNSEKPESEEEKKASFSITMLDVGQGLSILVSESNHHMLFDGGGRASSSFVVSYLKKQEVDHLDYIIASHYDEDHISGLVGALNTTTVDKAIMPDYSADTQTYRSLMRKIDTTNTPCEHPEVGKVYSLGESQIQILGPNNYNGENDNENSTVVRITYGSVSCIITGDAEEREEMQLVSSGTNIKSDVYIAGHHGSSSSSSEAFLDAVSPDCVLISVGEDNSYGHPTERVLSSLKKRGINMYRTDKQSTVTLCSDGKTYWFDTDPCNDWSAGDMPEETTESTVPASASTAKTYVLNTHTMKYHTPDCHSVSSMKDENKRTVETTREELIKEGYTPCGNCRPE